MSRWIQGRVDASPEECRYRPESVEAVAAAYEGLVESGTVHMAGFLMARGGRIFAHRTTGRRTFEEGSDPYRPEHIKTIASISKIVTATAIMQLAEEGKLWLEMPVKDVIPEFNTPMHSGIHLRHLLTHTSGLAGDGGYYNEPYPIDGHELSGSEDWLTKRVLAGPLYGEVGRQWAYCSMGFGVLAEVVSRVSGMHYHDYVEKRVFKAIGMDRSFLEVPKELWPETVMVADWEREAIPGAAGRKGMPRGGGGSYSTLYDLYRLGQCYMNGGEIEGGRLVSKKAAAEMTRNQLEGVPAFHWGKRFPSFKHGLGWGMFADGSFFGPRTYNHEGWGWCSLYVDPEEEFVFVMMAGVDSGWDTRVMVCPRAIAFAGIL
jgi:CubicO group peptidase (beta-lactamase class C family)